MINDNKKFNVFFTCGLILIICFLTVGYAVFYRDLGLNGVVDLKVDGKVVVTGVQLDTSASQNTLSNYGTFTIDENGNATLDYDFTISRTETTYTSTYLVSIKNNSVLDYTFEGFNIAYEANIPSGNEDNTSAELTYSIDESNKNCTLKVGEKLSSGDTGVVAVKLSIYVGTRGSNVHIGVDGTGSAVSAVENTGSFTVSLLDNSVDLRGNVLYDCFRVEVLNTYNYTRYFTLKSSNTNFILLDSNGQSLNTMQIDKPDDSNPNSNDKIFNICIKENENSIFLDTHASTSIIFSSAGVDDINVGNLNISVDLTEEEDNDIPEIGNVTFKAITYNSSDSSLRTTVSWNRLDSGGSNIKGYYILLYDEDGGLLKTISTNSSVESYDLILDSSFLNTNKTNMVTNNKKYYVKVYGEDESGNIGSSYCSSSDNKYCVASSSTSLKWEFNVDTSDLTYVSLSNGSSTKVYLNNAYTATITANTNYSLPGSITISMNGSNLEDTKYTYSSNNGTIQIYANVINNDISLSGTGSRTGGGCLVKGTKIKLYNGTYKNVEDINYDDLIQVYSNELGKIVYEYPIWIEKEGKYDNYQKTTFSDGSILETVETHGVYSVDENKYVSVLDRDSFHVGTKVVKINDKNEVEIVTVSKIETIEKEVSYYHIASSRYHNVIANDLLTTDAMLMISNMYKFNDDMTWSTERDEFLKTKDFYTPEVLPQFPLHMFKGFRMDEGKHLYNVGIMTIDDIKFYSYILLEKVLPTQINSNGENIWKVVTSDELDNNDLGDYYVEGSLYTLPEPINKENKEFMGWYSTADNKTYNIGDKVPVDYGTYFEAIWK